MKKRYTYRAYPTVCQTRALARLFGCVRVVFNDFVAAREHQYCESLPFESSGELDKRLLTRAKHTPERAWLADVSSIPLQQSLQDADRAYRNFFKGRAGKPHFKSRHHRQSARFTRSAQFSVHETTHGVGFVRIPKVGQVRFALSRPLPSDPSSFTIIREADGTYHVSFVVEVEEPEPVAVERMAGIDLGLNDFATIVYSDGTREKVSAPKYLRKAERRLAKRQRKLSRKQQGSRNREKARIKVARAHARVRHQRQDFTHQLSTRLARENQAVAVESLSITGLARTRLAKSVHDAGWGMFLRQLSQKTTVVPVDRWFPSTRLCSQCGVIGARKPLGVREWTCPDCGAHLDRDYNAAVNILVAAGLADTINACGGDVRPKLMPLALADATPCEAGTHRIDRGIHAPAT